MVKVTRNGWMTDEVYTYVLECLGKDLKCGSNEVSISYALSRRTGADVQISFTHQCRIHVRCDYDSIDELLILDDVDTDTHSPAQICCAIYTAVDACVNAARCNDIVYYDQETQYYGGAYDNDPEGYYSYNDDWHDEYLDDWYY